MVIQGNRQLATKVFDISKLRTRSTLLLAITVGVSFSGYEANLHRSVGSAQSSSFRVQTKDGSCLNVRYAHEGNGGQVIGFQCGTEANETWQFRRVSNGAWEIIAQHSGKCLDVTGLSQDNFAPIQQWECTHSSNQRWFQVDTGNPGWMMLRSEYSGKCLTFSYSRDIDGLEAIQYDCTGGDNQYFRVI